MLSKRFAAIGSNLLSALLLLAGPASAKSTAYTIATTGSASPLTESTTPLTLAQRSPSGRFLEMCEGNARYEVPYRWETVAALLAEVDTDDCAVAEARLFEITDLRLTGPEMPELVLTCILIDLPVAVDLTTLVAAMPNLTHLELSGRVIEDLSPIAELTGLRELHVANTQLQDISAIAALPQLEVLDVSYNQITDISAVGNIRSMKSLNLSNNPIRDISPLAIIDTWEALEYLDISGLDYDLDTCPPELSDACEGDIDADGGEG